MKIAVATEDNEKITSHFGRAPYYRVFTVENNSIVSHEQRKKSFHGGEHSHSNHQHDLQELPGGPVDRHDSMFAPIADCQVLLVGGMGEPAYAKAQSAGLTVVLTGGKIEDSVQAYLNGEVSSDMRRVHRH